MADVEEQQSNRIKSMIDEYKELRAEIRHYLDRRQKNVHFAFIVTLGVVGVGVEFRLWMLFFVSALLIAFLWHDEIRSLQAVFRLGAYIEIAIEPAVPGLNWERLGGLHDIQKSLLDRAIANGMFPVLLWVQAVAGIILLESSASINALILFFVAFVFFFLIHRSYIVAKYGRENEKKAWQKIADKAKRTI